MADASTRLGEEEATDERLDAPAEQAAPHLTHRLLLGFGPLVLLVGVVTLFLRFGPLGVFRDQFPPVEELTIERVTMPREGLFRVRVVNGGPEPVTVAQVNVDEATWTHTIDGPRRIPRLESRTIEIPYPWVQGEPHVITIVTGTGLTFSAEVPVATLSPRPDAHYLTTFALLGVYVGVIPVFLGLLWLPFLRGLGGAWLDFVLALTMGLLVFLGVDALAEALETATRVPGAFQGIGLVVLGLVGTPLVIRSVSASRAANASPPAVALLIATAIGLHNFGEGLAVGAAYAGGGIALGTLLVLGFLIHNTTEGVGIVAPLARSHPGLRHLAGLGLIAGAPTIAGTWIGAFTFSTVITTLAFAVGAGAIIQVLLVLAKHVGRDGQRLSNRFAASGLVCGLLIMYFTGLLVPA